MLFLIYSDQFEMRGREGRASVPAAVDGRAHRTPHCRRGSEPQHGSRSQAGGPSQRQPLGARCWRLEGKQRKAVAKGRARRAASELPQQPDGRESPGTDFSGRTGSRQRRPHRVVQQTQIDPRDRPCCTQPAGVSAPPARCPEPTRAQSAVYHSFAPQLPPRYPHSHSP